MSTQVEELLNDAPPPAEEATFDLGDAAVDFGLDSADAETPDPQTLPDASEEAGAEKVGEVAAADAGKGKDEAADKPVEAKPEEGADPELTAEENEIVKSRPEAEQGETARKLKAARFEDHYLNPEKPAEEVRTYLETKSPSRYGELEQTIFERRLADPDSFAADYFQKNPEAYGKLALAVFKGNPDYFVKAIAGREADPQTVRTALDFYERNRDRVTDEDAPELTPEKLEEIRQFFPEDADAIEQAFKDAKQARAAKPDEAKAEKPQPEKPAEQQQAEILKQQQAIKADQDKAWNAGYSDIQTYLTKKAEASAGVLVTENERKLAPDVAMLKDLKRHLLFEGMGDDLPHFEKGLGEWGENREGFAESLKAMGRFSQAREPDNVRAAARKLVPHADRYFDERLKHPVFQRLDSLIALAVKASNPESTAEEIVPGAGGNVSQQKASDPTAAYYEEAADYGLTT